MNIGGHDVTTADATGPNYKILTSFWADGWDWTNVKFQIDSTRAKGANCWRKLGSVYAVTSGRITRATYLARQTQIADYIAGLGGFYYPTGFDGAGFDPMPTAAEAHAELLALCQALVPYTAHIAAFSINNENPGWTIGNQAVLDIASLKAALPGVPFTSDCSEGFDITVDANRLALDPYVDFFDQHLYAGAAQPVTRFDALLAVTAKPVLIGEFGKVAATDPGAIATYFNSIGGLAQRIPPGGHGLAGYLMWTASDALAPGQIDSDADQYGMFKYDGTERTQFSNVYVNLPTA